MSSVTRGTGPDLSGVGARYGRYYMAVTTIDVGFNLAPQTDASPYRQVADIYLDGELAWSEPQEVARQAAELEHARLSQRTAEGIVYYATQNLLPEGEEPMRQHSWCHSFALEAGQSGVGIASSVLQYPEYPGLALAAAVVTNGHVVAPAEVHPGERAVLGNPVGQVSSQGDYPIAVHSLVGLGGDKSVHIKGNGSRLYVGTTSEVAEYLRGQQEYRGDHRQLDLYVYRESRRKRLARALWLTA